MSRYVVTAPAEEDLFEIWSYIATDSVDVADRVEAEIYAALPASCNASLAGHPRTDLTNRPVRFWALPRYSNCLVVYDPSSEPLRILRILHSARDASQKLSMEER